MPIDFDCTGQTMTRRRRWGQRRGKCQLTNFGKVLKVHQPLSCLIVVPEYLQNLCFLQIKAQGSHGDLKFVVIHTTIFVRVKELKSLFYLLLVLFREFWARVGASFGLCRGGRSVHDGWSERVKKSRWRVSVN